MCVCVLLSGPLHPEPDDRNATLSLFLCGFVLCDYLNNIITTWKAAAPRPRMPWKCEHTRTYRETNGAYAITIYPVTDDGGLGRKKSMVTVMSGWGGRGTKGEDILA